MLSIGWHLDDFALLIENRSLAGKGESQGLRTLKSQAQVGCARDSCFALGGCEDLFNRGKVELEIVLCIPCDIDGKLLLVITESINRQSQASSCIKIDASTTRSARSSTLISARNVSVPVSLRDSLILIIGMTKSLNPSIFILISADEAPFYILDPL